MEDKAAGLPLVPTLERPHDRRCRIRCAAAEQRELREQDPLRIRHRHAGLTHLSARRERRRQDELRVADPARVELRRVGVREQAARDAHGGLRRVVPPEQRAPRGEQHARAGGRERTLGLRGVGPPGIEQDVVEPRRIGALAGRTTSDEGGDVPPGRVLAVQGRGEVDRARVGRQERRVECDRAVEGCQRAATPVPHRARELIEVHGQHVPELGVLRVPAVRDLVRLEEPAREQGIERVADRRRPGREIPDRRLQRVDHHEETVALGEPTVQATRAQSVEPDQGVDPATALRADEREPVVGEREVRVELHRPLVERLRRVPIHPPVMHLGLQVRLECGHRRRARRRRPVRTECAFAPKHLEDADGERVGPLVHSPDRDDDLQIAEQPSRADLVDGRGEPHRVGAALVDGPHDPGVRGGPAAERDRRILVGTSSPTVDDAGRGHDLQRPRAIQVLREQVEQPLPPRGERRVCGIEGCDREEVRVEVGCGQPAPRFPGAERRQHERGGDRQRELPSPQGRCAARRARCPPRQGRERRPVVRVLECRGEGGRVAEAVDRRLREGDLDGIVDVLRHGLADHPDRRGRLLQVPRDHGLHVRPVEGRLSGQHLVRDAGERVDVAASVELALAGGLLGAHVVRRADRGARLRQPLPDLRADRVRDPEVGDERLAPREQDVLRLDVAVHDAVLVRVRERVRDLPGEPQGLVDGERLLAPEQRAQRVPLHVRHHAVDVAGRLPRVVEGEDVRVLQRGRDADLAQEAVGGESGDQIRMEDLDRDVALVAEVAREVDDRRRAPAQLPLEAIAVLEGAAQVSAYVHRDRDGNSARCAPHSRAACTS